MKSQIIGFIENATFNINTKILAVRQYHENELTDSNLMQNLYQHQLKRNKLAAEHYYSKKNILFEAQVNDEELQNLNNQNNTESLLLLLENFETYDLKIVNTPFAKDTLRTIIGRLLEDHGEREGLQKIRAAYQNENTDN